MKNWKSTLAFFLFVGIYIYSVYEKSFEIVDTVGYIALFSSIMMMFRSDITSELLSKAIDIIGKRYE